MITGTLQIGDIIIKDYGHKKRRFEVVGIHCNPRATVVIKDMVNGDVHKRSATTLFQAKCWAKEGMCDPF